MDYQKLLTEFKKQLLRDSTSKLTLAFSAIRIGKYSLKENLWPPYALYSKQYFTYCLVPRSLPLTLLKIKDKCTRDQDAQTLTSFEQKKPY